MKMDTEKALNLANMILGIGILLIIVPVGFTVITLATGGDQSVYAEITTLGWISVVILTMLPVGLGAFIGGLTWMSVLKRKAIAEDIEADDAKESE